MRLISKLLCSTVLICSSLAATAGQYSSLIVFGDSLSDPGNAAALTPTSPGALSFFPPTPSGRFTNGPTAAEDLAAMLGASTTLGWPNAVGGSNFAVGGAMTGSTNFNYLVNSPSGLTAGYPAVSATGIAQQIARYDSTGMDPNTTLFMLSGGANDFFYGFALAGAGINVSFTDIVTNGVNNMAANLTSLVIDKGARNILVAYMPDLGLTPFAQGNGADFAANASFLSNTFNSYLAQTVASLDLAFDNFGLNTNIIGVDTSSFLSNAIAHPYGGLTNVTEGCISSKEAIASNCAGYLFWDSVHPTALGHQLFANQLFAAAVPEPETWALLLVGLGLIGYRTRRRTEEAALVTACPPTLAAGNIAGITYSGGTAHPLQTGRW